MSCPVSPAIVPGFSFLDIGTATNPPLRRVPKALKKFSSRPQRPNSVAQATRELSRVCVIFQPKQEDIKP